MVWIFDRTLRFGVDAARRCCPSTSQFFGTGKNNYNYAVPGSVINVNVVLTCGTIQLRHCCSEGEDSVSEGVTAICDCYLAIVYVCECVSYWRVSLNECMRSEWSDYLPPSMHYVHLNMWPYGWWGGCCLCTTVACGGNFLVSTEVTTILRCLCVLQPREYKFYVSVSIW